MNGDAIGCEICPICGDEGRITLASMTSASTSSSLDLVTTLFRTASNAANGILDRYGKVLRILK